MVSFVKLDPGSNLVISHYFIEKKKADRCRDTPFKKRNIKATKAIYESKCQKSISIVQTNIKNVIEIW